MVLTADERRKKERDAKRARYNSDPEYRARVKARTKKWQQSHKGRIKSKNAAKRHRDKDPRRTLELRLKRDYALDIVAYDALVQQAGGRCMACGKARKLVVDHCHTTGKIRGLICHGCNVGLGLLGDTVAGLERTIAYLKRET